MSGEDQEIALFLQVLSPLSIKPEQQTAANFLLARSGVHGCAMRTSLSLFCRQRWDFGTSPHSSGMGTSLSYVFSTHMSPTKQHTNCCS